MQFLRFSQDGREGLAVRTGDEWRGVTIGHSDYPGPLEELVGDGARLAAAAAALELGDVVDPATVTFLPPLRRVEKIICVGLNYVDHSAESKFEQPAYPTLFTRFASTLVGHEEALICPSTSEQFDYEGELVAVIGRTGRNIPKDAALSFVAGWSIFNDASVRDYQFRTPQWTIGKNFDATGAFGPIFVTADELPEGARGLRLETRLNGVTVQSADTSDMVFDVATIIATVSEAMTLRPGDVVVTGTPAGVGFARTPPLWMRDGDRVEVEIEGIGILANPVRRAD